MAGGAGHVLSPLRPREFFSRPWSGAGEFVPKLLPNRRSRRFRFRSECEFVSDEEWIVHDTTQFEDGESSLRTMRARLISPDRIETTADTLVMISLVRSDPRCWSRYDASAGLGRVARLELVWIVPLVVASINTVDDLPTAVRPEPKLTLPSEGRPTWPAASFCWRGGCDSMRRRRRRSNERLSRRATPPELR